MRLVIDTNTLISGTLWQGPPAHLIQALEARRARLVISEALLAEFAAVVARPHLAARLAQRDVTPATVVRALAREAELIPSPTLPRPAELRDPKDVIVLAAAVAGTADAIVTGDQDLLVMKRFRGIPILSVREALEALRIAVE
ncbi:MAG: putative toxin-antitoxin system toxin component, PIN family [Verrucomicrobiales bacterium]|nr:putative toxin-antitoxin system toxin component, PIN family [Verrucomicrobiales bacterium]